MFGLALLAACAAPLPPASPDGLIWLHDLDANRLVAFRADGRPARDLALPKGDPFLGLTPDGRKILYAKGDVGRKTYHLRDVGPGTPGTDLGIDYSLFDGTPMWTRDGRKFIRVRGEDPKGMIGVRSSINTYAVCEPGTKKVTPLDVAADRWVVGWTPDEKGFITLAVGARDNGTLYVNRPGEGPTPLKFDGMPVWPNRVKGAPDGRTLLMPGYAKAPAGRYWHHAVWAADLTTGRIAELIHEEGLGYTEACWSPDGKRVCLLSGFLKGKSSDGWDEKRLIVANADGTARVAVTLDRKAKGHDVSRYGLVGWFPSRP